MINNLGQFFAGILAGILMVLSAFNSSAQLVSDGQTNILNGITTNLTGLTVGNSGSQTVLILTNAVILTNGGSVTVGNNATASSNLISLTTGTFWTNNGNVNVGYQGSCNRFEIIDSTVLNLGGYLGSSPSANSNLLMVSGAIARMTNSSSFYVGYDGAFNQLIVSNGAGLSCNSLLMGVASARSNLVLVTGSNSFFTSAADLSVYNKSNWFRVEDGAQAKAMQTTIKDGAGVSVVGPNSLFTNKNFITLSSGENSLRISNGGTAIAVGVTCGNYSYRNTIVVTDPGSLLTNAQTLVVAYGGASNQLTVANGGKAIATATHVGENSGSLNLLTVTDPGSVLSNALSCSIGYAGDTNSLVISNGATVIDQEGIIGLSGKDCRAVVTGTNSLWTNSGDLLVGGSSGVSAQLKVENGGRVSAPISSIGTGGSNCVATISDLGSFWTNGVLLYVGSNSVGNQLVISNQAQLSAQTVHVGENVSSSNNLVIVDGGTLKVNGGGSVMDVRRGTLLMRSGFADVDRLKLNTGSQSLGAVLGGRLRTKELTVANGAPFVIGGSSNTATLELFAVTTSQFNNGLVISTNGVLVGFGICTGNLYVGAGGIVALDKTNQSFASMNFSSIVFSNGSLPTVRVDPGRGSDSLVVTGGVTFGGTLQVIRTNSLATVNDFADGDSFRLFVATSYAGQFASINPATPGPGLKWNTNQMLVDGTLRVVSVNPPAPTVSAVAATPTTVTVSASGGISYDPCYLLSTTNVALPFSSWERWATNYYDTNGSTVFTNTIDSHVGQRYFAIGAQ